MACHKGLILSLVLILTGTLLSGSSSDVASTSQIELPEVLTQLEKLPTGRHLLGQALKHWDVRRIQDLDAHIQLSEVSRTDAVLTRQFDPKTGEESRTREVTVFLKADQSFTDALLDLSHELVHATRRADWDPYDPELNIVKYIRQALDADGGEVQAVVMECQVAYELSTALKQPMVSRCSSYVSQGRIDLTKIRLDFYRSGKWKKGLEEALGEKVLSQLPEIDESEPKFYSSTGRAPYPVSLYREFVELNQTACENTRRRLKSAAPLQDISLNGNRSPASESKPLSPFVQKSVRFLSNRCQNLD